MLKKNILNKILWSIVAVLLLLYAFSFSKVGRKDGDKRKLIKTALVNLKNLESIERFELTKGNTSLQLKKNGDFWIVSTNSNTTAIPADTSRVDDFIAQLIGLRSLYKISDKPLPNDYYGFSSENSFSIKYYMKDASFSELIFGKQDFSLSSRYLMSGKNLSVYEIDNSFETFLQTSIQAWSSPYIISQDVLGPLTYSSFQRIRVIGEDKDINLVSSDSGFMDIVSKLLELRHGGNGNLSEIQNALSEWKCFLEMGNKCQINIEIFPSLSEEREYNIAVTYKDAFTSKQYTYCSKISLWTYNKIREITL